MPVLDFPFPAAVRIFDLPSLFAGKIHALLCRSYLKGRDWYDFIWCPGTSSSNNAPSLGRELAPNAVAGEADPLLLGRRVKFDLPAEFQEPHPVVTYHELRLGQSNSQRTKVRAPRK